MTSSSHSSPKKLFITSLAALGVVYGDIGTSPLYALRETFEHLHGNITEEAVLSVLSIVTWSLILVVTIQYIGLVMRANQKGEGGILTLLSIGFPERLARRRQLSSRIIVLVGVFGAALLFGDGVITPAISVLSAVEGLEVISPDLHNFILPITSLIIIMLFWFQSAGTGTVGKFFGPVMIVWFFTLAALGIGGIMDNPGVLKAINPAYAISFFAADPILSLFVLSGVFLVVTGAEALYADMGHFGRRPIALAWIVLVFPALMLNYFGQGALLISNPEAIANPLQFLAPAWGRLPLLILSTLATIIASQALISGVFSITSQAIQLGYLPRMHVDHTSSESRGQIYIKRANFALMFICLVVVWGFKSSSNLASAYGIAVSLTMLVTTTLFFFAARRRWSWKLRAYAFLIFFGTTTLIFVMANMLKFLDGGWFPILLAILLFTMMITWKRGRNVLSKQLAETSLPLHDLVENLLAQKIIRTPGTAIFLAASSGVAPAAMIHNVKHNGVLHSRVIFLTIELDVNPFVDGKNKIEISSLGPEIWKVVCHYGFMEHPNIMDIIKRCSTKNFKIDLWNTSFFLSNNAIVPTGKSLPMWQGKLYSYLSRNAQNAVLYFRIPHSRVIEFAIQVEV